MPDQPPAQPWVQVVALGAAQTIAWASSTYLPAILGKPVAEAFGLTPATVFAAYSLALLVMAALGPAVGRAIDRRGGRGVLCLSNVVLAGGLSLLALSAGPWSMFVAWAVIGAGMALGLYDAAFAALVRQHGVQARGAITGITLLGGFASTLGWPLTSVLVQVWDWRAACLVWAVAHLVIALPLNWFSLQAVPPAPSPSHPRDAGNADGAPADRRSFVLLAVFGAATAFVTSAMAAHLPGFLLGLGVAAATAIGASALVGPAQVAARLLEFLAGRRFRVHPLVTARVACALHPLGAVLLLGWGGLPWVVAGFALLHGGGNGLITIAKGTLPLALFGSRGYGARQGVLAVAQRLMQALAPYVFALVMAGWGGQGAVALTLALSLVALAALVGIRRA